MEKERVTRTRSPTRWAIDISRVLNTVLGGERFPVVIEEVAREYSFQRFPSDHITLVAGDSLPGFEGALFRAPPGKVGWGIIYNSDIRSQGRINFTLAHEFGHYLLHRLSYPDGVRCGERDINDWNSEYRQIENQANVFAANLLMPLDDYRRQVGPEDQVDWEMLSHCAERYGVSLLAATLRWIDFTQRRAVLVVARDGYILWARSSRRAFKTGAFFRTSQGPIEVPGRSLAASRHTGVALKAGAELPEGTWLAEPCREMTIFADQYDFSISVLHLTGDDHGSWSEDEDTGEDLVDQIRRNHDL